jgi:putative peptidoglycan lipid II flippase
LNLLKALVTVSGMTLVSRVLGFVRDAAIARAFGAGPATDAFFVAFRLPNLLRRLFAEGAFSQAFVPILAEVRNRDGHAAARDLIDRTATLLAVILAAVTVVGVLAAPWIVWASAPGFDRDPDKFALTTTLLRVTFPYILFISLTALAGGVLNTWSRFSVAAFTPTLLNVSLIVFAALLAPHFDPPVLALAVGVFVGGVAQLAFQLPFLARAGLLPRWRFDPRHAGVRRVLRQMGPAIFGVSIGQLSLLVNTIFASFLVSGSVSWMYYADRLMEFPTGLLGVALGTVLLPSLARTHAEADGRRYSDLLDWGLRLTLLLATPAAVALAVLAVPLIATLFHHGAFDARDVEMTRQALSAYSVGLLGLILVKVLAPGFYARQDIRTPVRIAVVTLVATQAMNVAFIGPLRHAGLALAIGLGACLNAALLWRTLHRHGAWAPRPGWGGFVARLGVAVIAMAGVVAWVAGPGQWWLAHGLVERSLRLGLAVAAGAATYFAILGALGFRPRDFVLRAAA